MVEAVVALILVAGAVVLSAMGNGSVPVMAPGPWWAELVVGVALGLVVAQVAVAATTMYLHRGVTHKAVVYHPAVACAFEAVLWVTTGVQVRDWAGVHRRHHAALDTADDPHSPAQLGFWTVQRHNLSLYRAAVADRAQVDRYTGDLHDGWATRHVFRHGRLGPALGIVALVMVVGPVTGLVAAVTHLLCFIWLAAAVNAVGHTYGSRPQENSGTNHRLLAWVTAGEGLHNNHHAFHTAARFSWHSGEVDPSWPIIATLTRMHLARLRHPGGLPVLSSSAAGRFGSKAGYRVHK